jgi:hypothetical protein
MANGSAATMPKMPPPTQAASFENIFPFFPNIYARINAQLDILTSKDTKELEKQEKNCDFP